ncbi:MAG: tetratricopeptide repeat protein [Candidatus Omnitrophota bacterium]
MIAYLSILSFRLTPNYKNEIAVWTQALRQNPNSSIAYLFLGNVCFNTSVCTPDQALFLYQKSIQLNPDYLRSYISLGEFYSKNHRYGEALGAYEHAIGLGRPFAKIHCYRSISDIYLAQDQPAEALSYLEKAIALETDPKYQKEREKRPDASSQEAAIRCDLGTIYLMRGENKKAVGLFQEAVILNPKQANGYAGLGVSFMNLKDYKNAARAFQEATEFEPQNDSHKNNLAAAHTYLNQSTSNGRS